MYKSFEQSMLDTVLSCLERFAPAVIAVETMPPSITEYMHNHGGKFTEFMAHSPELRHGKVIQDQLGVKRLEAEEAANSLIQEACSKEHLSDENRQKLILYLVASYDLVSAVLQFSYLPKTVQEAPPALPDDVALFLKQALPLANEIFAIGVELARRLNIQRIASIDDHQDVDQTMAIVDKLFEHIDFDDVFKTPCFVKAKEVAEACIETKDLLELYTYYNSLEFLRADVESEWWRYLDSDIPDKLGRRFLSSWEVRNLNIASHIRRCSTFHPGGRILVVIGASHKAFLDNYLSNLLDVKVVQFADFVT